MTVVLIGALNNLRDFLENGDQASGYLINLSRAAFVGSLFVIFALASIGHLARLQRQLAVLAATDMLTGLPNRRSFLESIATNAVLKGPGTFLMVDLDHFKRINDVYGHAVGDLCLQPAADLLRAAALSQVALARLGGEEFGLFVPGPVTCASQLASRIAPGVMVTTEASAIVPVTMSVGLAYGNEGAAVAQVMSRADRALYVAKHEGRARWVAWSDELDAASYKDAI